MGAAAPGAVFVLGGALHVRAPRDPKLPRPPPTRASAALPAKTKAAARAIMTRLRREAIFIIVEFIPWSTMLTLSYVVSDPLLQKGSVQAIQYRRT
jgi:hypothetical protein